MGPDEVHNTKIHEYKNYTAWGVVRPWEPAALYLSETFITIIDFELGCYGNQFNKK